MAGGPRTYFHCHPEGADPGILLDPDNQVSEPWGEPEEGRTCDKCGGGGTTAYECFSCMEAGPDPGCPACQGRVRFEATCPACEGTGEIHRARRHGVAVFPSREGLYRYLAWKSDAGVEGKVVVELAGKLSEDRDLDADLGALLVIPEEVVSVERLAPELVGSVRNRVGQEAS
jgi:DnaJ-class molecular chaperone